MYEMLRSFSEVVFVLGVLMLIAGIIVRQINDAREPYKGRVLGTVVDIVAGEPDRKGKALGIHDYYYPVFAYYAGGRLMKEQYHKGSNPCEFHLNQQFLLYYDTGKPHHFKIATPGPLKKWEQLLYVSGIVALVCGVGCSLAFGLRFTV